MCEIERRAAMSEFASPFDALYKRALLHAQNREHAEAIDAFSEALRHAPEHADAYYWRAGAWLRLKRWKKAKADREMARKYGSESVRFIDRIVKDYDKAWKALS